MAMLNQLEKAMKKLEQGEIATVFLDVFYAMIRDIAAGGTVSKIAYTAMPSWRRLLSSNYVRWKLFNTSYCI